MKVLIVCEHFAPQTGAQALQAMKVDDALHEAGCELQVPCGIERLGAASGLYAVACVVPEIPRASRGFLGRLRPRIRYEFKTVHRRSAWVLAMADRAIQVSRTFEPVVIMTQSTPFCAHLIGMHLPVTLRRGWITYLSDLWPLPLKPYPYRTRLSRVLKPLLYSPEEAVKVVDIAVNLINHQHFKHINPVRLQTTAVVNRRGVFARG
jgi:hypothetical protein